MKKYFIYDSLLKLKFEKMIYSEVTEFLSKIPEDKLTFIHCWQKGQVDWLPIKEVEDFKTFFNKGLSVAPVNNIDLSEKTYVPGTTGIHRIEAIISHQIDLQATPNLETENLITENPQGSSLNQIPASSPTPEKGKLNLKLKPKISTNSSLAKSSSLSNNSEGLNSSVSTANSAIIQTPEVSLQTTTKPQTSAMEFSASSLEVSNAAEIREPTGRERRKHPRFEIKLRVIVTNKKNTFLTFTKDVSLGGLQLINEIPEYIFEGESEVFINGPNNKDSIKFKCKAIGDQQHKTRLQFEHSDAKLVEKLQLWIDLFIRPNAKAI